MGVKEKLKTFLNNNKILKKPYLLYSGYKYKYITSKKMRAESVINAVKIIKEQFQNKEYIVLYNPTWLGVANSSKGLFENCVPLMEIYDVKSMKTLYKAIKSANIRQVIFSQMVFGWDKFIDYIYKKDKSIKMKVLWHANNYETASDYTWGLNKVILKQYNEGKIKALAFVKKTMAEFYKKSGYNAFYLMNNVKMDCNNKEKLENEKEVNEKYSEHEILEKVKSNILSEKNTLKVGIYNAHSREIKNIFTQILAANMEQNLNVVTDIVPSSKEIEEYLDVLSLNYTSIKDFIPVEELMQRIKRNDINLYTTFTECSPMFPMESFETGVPCLIGNNNDYFLGSKLREYVCVDREDDPVCIYNKMKEVLKNKKEVMKLYKEWKENFEIELKDMVKQFIND